MSKGCDLKHPARRGQSKGHAALSTADPRHLALRNRVRRGHIDRHGEIVALNQPFDGAAEIFFVNPRNELVPAGNRASQPPSREASESSVYTPLARCEDHSSAQRNLPRGRRPRFIEGLLPSARDLDGKAILGLWSRANFPGRLIHEPVKRVFVDGCCTGVQPHRWWVPRTGDGFAQYPRCLHSRLEDIATVASIVTAIHRSPREINQYASTVELSRPFPQGSPIPTDLSNVPIIFMRRACENHDVVVPSNFLSKKTADEAATTCDEDATTHNTSPSDSLNVNIRCPTEQFPFLNSICYANFSSLGPSSFCFIDSRR